MGGGGERWETCDGAELVTDLGVKKLEIDFCVVLPCEGVGFPIADGLAVRSCRVVSTDRETRLWTRKVGLGKLLSFRG